MTVGFPLVEYSMSYTEFIYIGSNPNLITALHLLESDIAH